MIVEVVETYNAWGIKSIIDILVCKDNNGEKLYTVVHTEDKVQDITYNSSSVNPLVFDLINLIKNRGGSFWKDNKQYGPNLGYYKQSSLGGDGLKPSSKLTINSNTIKTKEVPIPCEDVYRDLLQLPWNRFDD